MRSLLVPLLLCAACGDDGSSNHATPDASKAIDAAVADTAVPPDADVRNQSIELLGGANGLYWDDAAQKLYLTDDNNNWFEQYTDAGGVTIVATLPTLTGGSNPGGIARLPDGTFVTPNFAMGTSAGNTLLTIDPVAKTAKAVTGLDGSHHRIGIGATSAGVLYDTYFAGNGAGNQTGAVARIAIAADSTATETDLAFTAAPGFKKLVGLAVTDTAVFVSDQTQGMIFKIALADDSLTTVAAVASPDLLTLMPDGDLISGGTAVRRITQAGAVTTLFATEHFDAVHGSAYDPTGKRLFFINHSATAGTKDRLEVRPLDQ